MEFSEDLSKRVTIWDFIVPSNNPELMSYMSKHIARETKFHSLFSTRRTFFEILSFLIPLCYFNDISRPLTPQYSLLDVSVKKVKAYRLHGYPIIIEFSFHADWIKTRHKGIIKGMQWALDQAWIQSMRTVIRAQCHTWKQQEISNTVCFHDSRQYNQPSLDQLLTNHSCMDSASNNYFFPIINMALAWARIPYGHVYCRAKQKGSICPHYK